MKKTDLYLRADQRATLTRLAKKRGVSMAELVRQAIDAYVDTTKRAA